MAYDLLFGRTKRDWSCGSMLIPAKQQKALFQKIDDVRYDLRKTRSILGSSIFALSGALAFLAIASVYRTSRQENRR